MELTYQEEMQDISTWTNDALDTAVVEGHRNAEREAKNAMESQERAVNNAWRSGRALIERRTRLSRGEWYPYLAQIGIAARKAQKYMEVAEIRTEAHLPSTIDLAIKTARLQKAEDKPIAKKRVEQKLTPLDKALMRAEEAENANKSLQKNLAEERETNETLRMTRDALKTEVFNAGGGTTRVASEIEQVREREKQARTDLAKANSSIVDLNREIRQNKSFIKSLLGFIRSNGLEFDKNWNKQQED